MGSNEFMMFYERLVGEGGDRLYYQFDNAVTACQYKTVIDVASQYVSRKAKVLDWSCGNGHFSHFLTTKCDDVHATSFDDNINSVLMGNPKFSFKRIEPEEHTKIPFSDGEFDSVFSIGVLEHVHETGGDQEASLLELNRIIKNGGHFLCFHLPNAHSIVERMGQFVPQWVRTRFHLGSPHSRRFSRENVVSMLKQSGFSMVEYGFYNLMPRNSINAFPNVLKKSAHFADMYNAIDSFLQANFSKYSTQSYFVAQKL